MTASSNKMHHLLPPSPITPSSSASSLNQTTTTTSTDVPKEYKIVLLGTHHKQPLFNKLCTVAQKFEQHIQYADICYLTYQLEGWDEPVVVELIDPGTERTGERQMAIQQKADVVILCYAAYNPDSFHVLETVVEDFQTLTSDPPATLLLCNDDQFVEEGGAGNEAERADDGYASASGEASPQADEQRPISAGSRRHSMEQIRSARDEERCPITREEGEQLCSALGSPDFCEFRTLSFRSQLADQFMLDLVDHLIHRAAEAKRKSRRRHTTTRSTLTPSPLKEILRKSSSLKRLLAHSKSDLRAERKAATKQPEPRAATNSESGGVAGQRKRHSGVGGALWALTHPRERARVAASKGNRDAEGGDNVDPHHSSAPTTIRVHSPPPTVAAASATDGVPSYIDAAVRVNNFVDAADRQVTSQRKASHPSEAASPQQQMVRNFKAGGGGGARSSVACVIQ